MAQDHYIELVGKVVRVTEALRDAPAGLSLQEIAARTGYVKSSAHRILQSLRRHGYVEQASAGGSYRLGMQFLILARGFVSKIELVKLGRPFLDELVEKLEESAFLAELRGSKGIFVDSREAMGELRLAGPLFAEIHLHATAAGKAMGAFLPEEARMALHRTPWPALTPLTKTDPADVEREWETVRKLGYALNDEETIAGALFLAAPLLDSRQRICGSISVGAPKMRLTPGLIDRMILCVSDVCRRLSAQLEATGYLHPSWKSGPV